MYLNETDFRYMLGVMYYFGLLQMVKGNISWIDTDGKVRKRSARIATNVLKLKSMEVKTDDLKEELYDDAAVDAEVDAEVKRWTCLEKTDLEEMMLERRGGTQKKVFERFQTKYPHRSVRAIAAKWARQNE